MQSIIWTQYLGISFLLSPGASSDVGEQIAIQGFKDYTAQFFGPCHSACGILIAQPGTELMPLEKKRWVLTTRLPGNYPQNIH